MRIHTGTIFFYAYTWTKHNPRATEATKATTFYTHSNFYTIYYIILFSETQGKTLVASVASVALHEPCKTMTNSQMKLTHTTESYR